LSGLKEVYVLHGGRLECTAASCIGAQCNSSEYDLKLLHVQDEGFVKLGDSQHMPELQMNLVNFTVSSKYLSLLTRFENYKYYIQRNQVGEGVN
jgi:hypothetical protein